MTMDIDPLDYLGLARSLAVDFAKADNRFSLDDLYGVAVVGLMKAVRSNRSDSEFKFSTYAHAVITNNLRTYYNSKIKHLNHLISEAEVDKPEFEKPDPETEWDIGTGANEAGPPPSYLPQPSRETDTNIAIDDMLGLIQSDVLTDTERDILTSYYGIECEAMTQPAIAKARGVSHQYIGAEIRRALAKLRKELI